MCCGNASGSHFNKLCVIGTAKKPPVFQSLSIENLPVDYYHNKSAWMDRQIFTDWFHHKFVPAVKERLTSKGLL